MQKSDDRRGKRDGYAISAVKGLAAGFIVIFVIFAIAAALISSGKTPEGAMKVLVVCAAFFGSLAGAVVAIKRHGARALALGLTVGGAVFILTLIGAAFSEDGGLVGALTPWLLLALVAGGVFGSFICTRKKGRKRA